jgi:hypothetical protein
MNRMNSIEKVELEMALSAVRQLAENEASSRVLLEWKPGEHPTVTFVPIIAVEFISVNFTVQDEVENG